MLMKPTLLVAAMAIGLAFPLGNAHAQPAPDEAQGRPEAPADVDAPAPDESPAPAQAEPPEVDETPAPVPPQPAPASPAPAEPAAEQKTLDIDHVSLETLLSADITAGESGAFGSRLSERDAKTYLHAFAITEGNKFEDQPFTFELEFFNMLFGARIGERVLAEGQIEITENGQNIRLKYGQVDVTVVEDRALLRVGKFLAPIGVFNEYLYPEYVNKMVFPPASNLRILPRGFTVVGAQLRGKYDFADEQNINYAVYVANNPLEEESEPGGEEEEEISAFIADGAAEESLTRKAYGGRLGAKIKGLNVGVSGFFGTYDAEEKSALYVANVDVSYQQDELSLRSEFLYAQKKDDGEAARKGFFVQAAYKLLDDHLEPALQYDRIDGAPEDEDNRQTFTIGLNYYPLPETARHLIGKVNGVYSTDGDNSQTALLTQFALGF